MHELKSWDQKRACTVLLLCSAATVPARAQTHTTLADFHYTGGNQHVSSLVLATDGNFYGTTQRDGTYGNG
jgi:hypothetical protein